MIAGFIAFTKAFALSLTLISSGMATTFGEKDIYNPNPHLACLSEVNVKDTMKVVAHRTLECGTLVTVCKPDLTKCTTATVADRGPYGCWKWKGKPKKSPCLKYKSQLDMTPAVVKAIKHDGYEPIIFIEKKDSQWEKQKRLREIKRASLRSIRLNS